MTCGWPIAPAHERNIARRADVAAFHHRERVVELRAEEPGAPRVPRERGERLEDGDAAAVLAEARLDTPDGDDDLRRHAVLLRIRARSSRCSPAISRPRRTTHGVTRRRT